MSDLTIERLRELADDEQKWLDTNHLFLTKDEVEGAKDRIAALRRLMILRRAGEIIQANYDRGGSAMSWDAAVIVAEREEASRG